LLLLVGNGRAETGLSDPYQILHHHYEAIGGLERLKAERTSYFEGKIEVIGLEGTIKQWAKMPILKRQEVDLGIFRQTVGDNGRFGWIVDQNGKLQIKKDEATVKKRKVDELLATYDHLDPESEYFTLTLEGIQPVGDVDCYVVRIANNINSDVRLEHINTSDFYLEKSIAMEADHEVHTLHSDFRDVDGIKVPFRQDIEILPIGQKQTIQLSTYESNIEIESSLFEPPEEDVEDFQFVNGENAEDVPFQYTANHLFLKVKINCEERLWCLDTGASSTVIDATYASELGLESEGEAKGLGARGTAEFSFVALPPYSIQGIQFAGQKVVSGEMSGLFKTALGLDVVGVLGYDFLSRFVTKVDYANERLSFYHPERFEYEGEGRVLDAPLKNGLFQVEMTVDDEHSGDWALDIGAGGVSFYYPFAEDQGLLDLEGVERRAGGASGFHGTRVSQYRAIEFAGHSLEKPLISVPLQKGGAFASSEGIGNVGNSVFRHFVLYLDYERQQVIVEKGDDFDREFPRDKSGLQLWLLEDESIEVMFVSPNTPADEAGLKEGDILRTINRIDVDHFAGLIAVRELLAYDAGTEYDFEVVRDDELLKVSLRLEELY
jgi:hypothetical protein